jgi:hypothetical protein
MKKKEKEKTDNCGICLECLNNDIEILECTHIFHPECIKKLVESKCTSKHKCPICRHEFTNITQKPQFTFSIIHACMFSRPLFYSNLFA